MSWTIQLPTGEYLDSVPSLSFELNNQVFSSSDTSALPGTFSFPFEIPLSRTNLRLLNHPNLVNNSRNFRVIPDCWIYASGVPMFKATLTVRKAGPTKAQITLVSNPLGALKDAKLPEIPLGGDRSLIPLNLNTYFDQIADEPEQYDYALFPVVKTLDDLNTVISYTTPANFHNYYARASAAFDTVNTYAITPFVKLEYLLQQMFELAPGVRFENAWQINTELKRLYIFNNRDARVSVNNAAPSAPTSLNLRDFVPDEKCNEYLRDVCAVFNLGVFTNIFKGKVRLVPLETVLTKAPKWDWTTYVAGDVLIENDFTAPGSYNWPQIQEAPPEWPPIEDAEVFPTLREYYENTNLVTDLNKFYYIEDLQKYVKYVYGLVTYYRIHQEYFHNKRQLLDSEQPAYQIRMENLHPYGVSGYPLFVPNYTPGASYYNPDGVSRWEQVTENNTNVYKFQAREYRSALMFYRGIQQIVDGLGAEPFAANHVWKPSSWPAERSKIVTNGVVEGDAEYSLNWFGQYGLFERWHKRWHNMLANAKTITVPLILPLSVFTSFEFEDQVTIQSMNYIVRRMRLNKLIGSSKVLVEATLISVI